LTDLPRPHSVPGMEHTQPHIEAPLPSVVSWFAPWTWKRRWMIVFAMLLMFIVYPLSAGPINRFVELGWLPQWVFFYSYLPLLLLSDYNPLFRSLFTTYLYLCSPSCC
jgi:hypothetical protein